MYQLQDQRMLNSKHNSIVFTHIEILNQILQNYKHKSHYLAHLVHLENTGLQNATPNYQLVSLTSQLFKLNIQNTST
jgi:hypothetical protein